MKVLQKTAEHTIYQKRSGRHAVKSADNNWVNGEDKVKILLEAGLIKVAQPAEPEPEPVAEPEAAEEAADADAEEAPAEETAEDAAEESEQEKSE